MKVSGNKLLAMILLAGLTFMGLDQAGYVEGVRTAMPVVGIELDGEFAKVLWTVVSALVPVVLTLLPPWLRPIVEALIEALLPQSERDLRALARIRENPHLCEEGKECCDDLLQHLWQSRYSDSVSPTRPS